MTVRNPQLSSDSNKNTTMPTTHNSATTHLNIVRKRIRRRLSVRRLRIGSIILSDVEGDVSVPPLPSTARAVEGILVLGHTQDVAWTASTLSSELPMASSVCRCCSVRISSPILS